MRAAKSKDLPKFRPFTCARKQSTPPINKALARRVLQVVQCGLVFGLGDNKPGRMCVEAAVCYAMGLPHSDEPICVSPVVREFKILLNDQDWSGPKTRAKGLQALAIAQLGSGTCDERQFVQTATIGVLQRMVIPALREFLPKLPSKTAKAEMQRVIRRLTDLPDLEAAAVLPSVRALPLETALLRLARKLRTKNLPRDPRDHISSMLYTLAEFPELSRQFSQPPAAGLLWDLIRSCLSCVRAQVSAMTRLSKKAKAQKIRRETHRLLRLTAQIGLEALKAAKSPGCKWLYLLEETK